jgi:hypothetical protein
VSRAAILTGTACLSLLAIIGGELLPSGDERGDPLRSSPAMSPRDGASAEAPSVGAWADIVLSRPLFSQDRRPTAAARAAIGGLPRLAGTIRADQGELAIFQPADSKPVVVGRGARVADWIVSDIADGAVTLQRGSSTTTLRLSYANAPIAAPPAVPSSPEVLHDKRSNPFLQP